MEKDLSQLKDLAEVAEKLMDVQMASLKDQLATAFLSVYKAGLLGQQYPEKEVAKIVDILTQ